MYTKQLTTVYINHQPYHTLRLNIPPHNLHWAFSTLVTWWSSSSWRNTVSLHRQKATRLTNNTQIRLLQVYQSNLWTTNQPSGQRAVPPASKSDDNGNRHFIIDVHQAPVKLKEKLCKNVSIETYLEKRDWRAMSTEKNERRKQLDPHRMEKIKEAVFMLYPLEQNKTEAEAWKDCVHAKDESGRQLNSYGRRQNSNTTHYRLNLV